MLSIKGSSFQQVVLQFCVYDLCSETSSNRFYDVYNKKQIEKRYFVCSRFDITTKAMESRFLKNIKDKRLVFTHYQLYWSCGMYLKSNGLKFYWSDSEQSSMKVIQLAKPQVTISLL
ncbi:hypothetical protein CHS0354_008395 [Potamilus streckersoni]|uniref:Uncharacterized protein n=1 Tax=Potamilus streckersoni TaxID=2493646 RepID=A0AAE0RPL1_9BIVA|nr:hypothetical protein CHS0354_008395 [Potamilus streckersoni]